MHGLNTHCPVQVVMGWALQNSIVFGLVLNNCLWVQMPVGGLGGVGFGAGIGYTVGPVGVGF